ncbi:MAG: hypothetical protein JXR36_12235 [Bacteroidales bacterium]|nr:hypothetical protein [Bacteroidales bacterium]
MKREVKKYFFDVQTSIDSISEYLGDKRDFTEYQGNKLLRRGIEREIEIIGEAITRIMKIAPEIKIDTNLISKSPIGYCNYFVHVEGEKSCHSISYVNFFQRSRCAK